MKRLIYTILLICITYSTIFSQNLSGRWRSSSGSTFIISEKYGNYIYKNTSNISITFYMQKLNNAKYRCYMISNGQLNGLNNVFTIIDNYTISVYSPFDRKTFTWSKLLVNVKIKRTYSGDDCMRGELYVNSNFIGYTLEYPWRGNTSWNNSLADWRNMSTISCVPSGSYNGYIKYNHKDKWRLQLSDRGGRTSVQIHIGNLLKSNQTKGCILIGKTNNSCTVGNSAGACNSLKNAFYGTSYPTYSPDVDLRVSITDAPKSSTNIEGTGSVTSRYVTIKVIDHNSVQDDYYDLYVNSQYIGKVHNPPGGEVTHKATLKSGRNIIELRFTKAMGQDTNLKIKITPGNFEQEFSGSNNHTYVINAP